MKRAGNGWKAYQNDKEEAQEIQLLWAGSDDVTVTAATFPLDEAQTLTAETNQGTAEAVKKSDHLFYKREQVKPSTDGISVEFSHIMSKVKLTITLGDEFNETNNPITDVTFMGTMPSNTYTPGTGWEKSMTGDAANITALCNKYIKPTTTAPNAVAEYEVILVPQTVAVGDFSVQFNVGNRVFKWNSESEVTLESGCQYELNLTAGKDKVSGASFTASPWTENANSSKETE